MHPPIYVAICSALLGGVLLLGAPDDRTVVLFAVLAIALVGVPHGGLDHWVGRRLLEKRFKHGWGLVFFPAYMVVGLAFACGWFFVPSVTVVLFFLISAWHFGREDQQSKIDRPSSSFMRHQINHLAATAIGGFIIWVPVLVRPDEFRSLLSLIVPAGNSLAVSRIIEVSQTVALILVPLGLLNVVQRLVATPRDLRCWVPFSTCGISVGLPILLSFSLYFCGWHSWQGLERLRRTEALSTVAFVRYAAPLSVAAIVGVVAAGFLGTRWMGESSIDGQTPESLRTLFIGLSAIAVPHLILHELHSIQTRSQLTDQVFA